MLEKEHFNVLDLFQSESLVKVCAPMVRYSKLQFRNLVKKYECDLVFTPMILADSFCQSNNARKNEFTTNLVDSPLVVQFASNTVHDFVGASCMVAPYCDGVDLNCGCPQRWAKEQGVGCEMLKTPQLIYELVRECRNKISKPFTVSVKMRILKDLCETVEICRRLEHCGVSFLSVHARTKEQTTGEINEESLKLISENTNIPVIGNGGVTTLEKCVSMRENTKVKGVMIANAILTNPTLFSGTKITNVDCIQNWLDICYNSTLSMKEFNCFFENEVTTGFISDKPKNLTFQCFHHHLVFMLEKILTRAQKRVFNNLKKFGDVQNFIFDNFDLKPKLYKSQDEFIQRTNIETEFDSGSKVYNDLKPDILENNDRIGIFDNYNTSSSDGKYFGSKVDDHSWTDIFLENG